MPTPANPEDNQFRCEACGRHFNSMGELKLHQTDCLAAKAAGKTGNPAADNASREEGEDREWVSTP